MQDHLIKTPIFHITAIDNLTNIAASRYLFNKKKLDKEKLKYSNIAYSEIQDRRASKFVPVQPGGTLHDYVPFSFAPRSPMLFTIGNGNVPGCNKKQSDIAHLVTTAQIVEKAGHKYAFTDFHAILAYTQFFNNLKDLDKIDWDVIFEHPKLGGYCQYWHSKSEPPRHARRKETRQAEFLIHGQLAVEQVRMIAVQNESAVAQVAEALKAAKWDVPVKSKPDWYY